MGIIKEKYKTFELCPECKSILISIKEKGETVCRQCGLVINEREFILSLSEKKVYNQEEKAKKKRTGPFISPLLQDIGLSTSIYKNKIHNQDLKRVIKRNTYLSWKNRNILNAIIELKRICFNLDIPSYIRIAALRLYKEAFKSNIFKGRSIKGMVAACLYYSIKKKHIPITFQEILNETNVSSKTIKNCYMTLIKTFKLKVPIINPISFIPRYTADLNLNIEVETLTTKILLSYLRKTWINGINPRGLCAGAIYLASKLKKIKINQKKIAEIVGVTAVTLRSRYRELINSLNLISI